MKACFSTFYRSDNYGKMAEQMVNSLRHFHPDIPIEIFNKEKISEIMKKHKKQTLGAYIGNELNQIYDLIIHIDADCIITGELTEILNGDYDIACVRNNNDFDKAGMCSPGFSRINILTGKQIEIQEYINAGCYACRDKRFWNDWYNATVAYANTCMLEDQDTFNDLIYSGKYKSVILDSMDKPYYYGVANTWGEKSHYESWERIELKDDKLFLEGKQIKILHAAGGEAFDNKFNFDGMFQPNVSSWLKNITKEGIE